MVAAIVDSGPLIALLDASEQYHQWARAQLAALDPPLLSCEPVITETMYLLRGSSRAQEKLFDFLGRHAIRLAFHVEDHIAELRQLHAKYRDRPMTLADACIVRMAELNQRHAVLTLDSDFAVYRKHGRELLTVISPSSMQ